MKHHHPGRETRMSFYVALPSHANRREFPQNQAHSFKIRLPHPLHLPGGQWQVGLSAISLPDRRVNMYDLVKKGDHVMGIKWTQTVPTPVSHDSHESALAKNRQSQRPGLDCGWGEFQESGYQSCGTTTTGQSGPRRQICQRLWSTHVCQVSMGGRRPSDRQHQHLSLWSRHHSQRRVSHQTGAQDGLDRAIEHPLVRVCVRPQLATRIPKRSSPRHETRHCLERSER